jgi:hypothetical protein
MTPRRVAELHSYAEFVKHSDVRRENALGVGMAQLRAHPRVSDVQHMSSASIFTRSSLPKSWLVEWCRAMDHVLTAAASKTVETGDSDADAVTPVCLWWSRNNCVTASLLSQLRKARPRVVHVIFDWDLVFHASASACHSTQPPPPPPQYDVVCVTDDGGVYAAMSARCVYPAVYVPRSIRTPRDRTPRDFDVSFAANTLYRGVDTGTVPRLAAIRALAAAFGDRFALFGPSEIRDIAMRTDAPACFRDYLPYTLIPWQAATTNVCLCLSASAQPRRYVNERLALMLACGANVLCSRVMGYDEDDFLGPCGHIVTYVRTTDANDLVAQVHALLSEPECVREERRARAYAFAQAHFGDGAWARGIVDAAAANIGHAQNLRKYVRA